MSKFVRSRTAETQVTVEHSFPEDQVEEQAPENTQVPENKRTSRILSSIKSALSSVLLLFSIFVVMVLMATRQTHLSHSIHPAATILLFWLTLIWLAAMEGSQTSLVGLAPIKQSRYADSHPLAYASTKYIHKNGNLERFIVGRQFLVFLAVFVTELLAGSVVGAEVSGLPKILNMIFASSGVAMILITVIVGQLMAEVNASRSMLDTINNSFVLYFVTYASMAVEASGLLHATYLVQIMYSKLSGKKPKLGEPERTLLQKVSFWLRVAFSCALLVFSFAAVLVALFEGKTSMWKGIPSGVSVVIFFLLIMFVGMLEGMQIAIVAVLKLPEETRSEHELAKKNCDLALRGENLQAFMIGRQMLVTASMFVVARITGTDVEIGQGQNIFGVSDQVQETLFNSNILAAIVTTIAASLVWRVVASSSPISFLSSRIVYYILWLCLIVEATGCCSAASELAKIPSKICRFKPDEEYIGDEETEVDLEQPKAAESVKSGDTEDDPSTPRTVEANRDDDEFSVVSF